MCADGGSPGIAANQQIYSFTISSIPCVAVPRNVFVGVVYILPVPLLSLQRKITCSLTVPDRYIYIYIHIGGSPGIAVKTVICIRIIRTCMYMCVCMYRERERESRRLGMVCFTI